MDAVLLVTLVKRPVKFIVAAKSMRRPVVGYFANKLGGVPVERAQDLAFKGIGIVVNIHNERIYVIIPLYYIKPSPTPSPKPHKYIGQGDTILKSVERGILLYL